MSELTDIELISLIREGKDENLSILYQRYEGRAKKLASDYYYSNKDNGIAFDDYYSRAIGALYIVVKKYDVKRAESMYSYWRRVAEHEIQRLISQQSYFGGAKSFYGLSLDASISNEDDMSLSEKVSLKEPDHQYDGLVEEMIFEITKPNSQFTNREQQILLFYLDGEDRLTVQKILGIKSATYYSHFRRANEKLKKLFNRKKF